MLFYILRRSWPPSSCSIVMSIVTFLHLLRQPRPTPPGSPAARTARRPHRGEPHFLGFDKPLHRAVRRLHEGPGRRPGLPGRPGVPQAHPDQVTHCPAPCLGYSPLQPSWSGPHQAASPGHPVARPRRVRHLDRVGVRFGILAALAAASRSTGVVGVALVFYSFPTFFIALLPTTTSRPVAAVRRPDVRAARPQNPACGSRACCCPDHPGRRLRRRLRPAHPRVHARDDGRGLPAHRRGPRACPSGRSSSSTPCAPR